MMEKELYLVGFTRTELRYVIKCLQDELDENFYDSDSLWFREQKRIIEKLKGKL